MKMVCLGDSVTYGYGVKRKDTWVNIVGEKLKIQSINKGISGDTSSGMLSRIYNDVMPYRPTHTIVLGGSNDLIWNIKIGYIMANLSSIVFQLMQYNIIPIIGVPIPIYREKAIKNWGFMGSFDNVNKDLIDLRYNIKNFCRHYGIKFLDFYSLFFTENTTVDEKYYIDGLHLNEEGNKKMADLVENEIK